MRVRTLSMGMKAAPAIFTLALLVATGQEAPKERVLHSFKGSDGFNPFGDLVFDAAGNLYGTTRYGGDQSSCPYNCGTVFELLPKEGGSWTEKVLHNFSFNGRDGFYPYAGLIRDTAGNLYGTTAGGGDSNCFGNPCGTVFELTPQADGAWPEKLLHPSRAATETIP